jgi:hypothetical protein
VLDATVIEPRGQRWSSVQDLRDNVERLRERLDVAQTRKALLEA